MSNPSILVTDSGSTLGIEISRREKKNAITADMYRAMSTALGHVRDTNHVRAVLIAAVAANEILAAFLAKRGPDPQKSQGATT